VPLDYETNNPLTLIMDANKNITANFVAVQTAVVSLNSGWNLISMPRIQSNDSASVLFPHKIGSVYVYDSALRQYRAVMNLRNGLGYWVNNSANDSLAFVGAGPGMLIDSSAQAGWVIIGSCDTTTQVFSLILDNGASIIGSAYRYDAIARIYRAVTAINPGEAVWINVNKQCTITIP
jgi:hypothetical protein